jgi:hypothetical protein
MPVTPATPGQWSGGLWFEAKSIDKKLARPHLNNKNAGCDGDFCNLSYSGDIS